MIRSKSALLTASLLAVLVVGLTAGCRPEPPPITQDEAARQEAITKAGIANAPKASGGGTKAEAPAASEKTPDAKASETKAPGK